MDFLARSPFSGCDLETLRDVYLVYAERGEMETSLLVNLGVAFHREKRFEEARNLFEAAVRREGDSLTGRLGLAQAVVAMGDTAAGREMTQALAVTDGLTPEMRGVVGALWLGLGEYEAAERLLTEAVDAAPPAFSFSFNRGLARFHQGRFAEAKLDFERALGLENRAEAWFNLGLVCDALDEREEASAAFERYLELVPEGQKSIEARQFIEHLKR
jgi:tetratricopeptide (TPR) repeat protein